MAIDERTLGKELLKRALTRPGNLGLGTGALVVSAALANPLPLILWGACQIPWTIHVAKSKKHVDAVLRQKLKIRTTRVESERGALVRRIESLISAPPFTHWVRDAKLPDYLDRYHHLVDIRHRVAEVAHNRAEVEDRLESLIVRQLDQMLTAYLKFVQARLMYLQILTGVRVGSVPAPVLTQEIRRLRFSDRLRRFVFEEEEAEPAITQSGRWVRMDRSGDRDSHLAFDLDLRLRDFAQKIEDLAKRAKRQPATATIIEQRVKILEQRKQLLEQCRERDERVAAQLEAFPDAFEFILDRVRTSEFSATEITGYMGSVVEQVEETEQFVESMRPMMDAELGTLAALTE